MRIEVRDLFVWERWGICFYGLLVLSIGLVLLASSRRCDAQSPEERPRLTRQSEIIYEGLVSYGNYRVFGGAENAKLYVAGVEFNRELWPNLLRARVDAAFEILPVILLTQPHRTDIWGDTLSRRRNLVPGAGITPIGLRFLWRDGTEIMPYFEAKGTVLGFTQKALSPQATYENWSFQLTQGVKLRLKGRFDLRVGVLNDLHFSNAFVVRSNPALDVMNVNVGLVYHLHSSRKSF